MKTFRKSIFKNLILAFFICLLALCALGVEANNFPDSLQLSHAEMPVYDIPESKYLTVLNMGYARAAIKNPEAWQYDRRTKQVVIVDLVFTQYPRSKKDWKTNYDTLLNRRIKAVEALIPELKDNPKVKWNLILQTDCSNEKEAKEMFHGAIIKFRLILPDGLRASLKNVREIVTGRVDFQDSVVFKVFERNPGWKDMVIVKDWTGSMYDYGAQAILWHRLNMEKNAVKQIIFFNDGDQKPKEQKVVGETGGIYAAEPQDIRDVIKVMREVMLQGNGGDSEENDIEALLHANKQFDAKAELILIADNKSAIRDISLATDLKKPIRIILCGTQEAPIVHPDYLRLAKETTGSIHTIEEDIMGLSSLKEGESIKILGVEYKMVNGELTPLTDEEVK